MKILYHHRTAAKDGMDVHITEMVNAFRQLGHDVLVVGPEVHDETEFGKGGETSDFLRKLLPNWCGEILELIYDRWVAYPRLERAYKSFQPDVLYERNNLFLQAGMRLKKKYRVPFLLEINAPLASERDQHGGLGLKRLAHKLEARVWRAADKTFPVSGPLARIVREKGVAQERICVVHNAVNSDVFHPQVDGTAVRKKYGLEDATVLGFTGFLRDWHGLENVIETLAALGDTENLHLLVVGDGPARETLELTAKERGVEDRVHFTGIIDRGEIANYIAAFDIALQPAVTPYASPLKLFEYMGMGKTIIAPDQENIREILPVESDDEAHLLLERRIAASFGKEFCVFDLQNYSVRGWAENVQSIV